MMKIRSMLKFDSPSEMSVAVLGSFVSYLLGVLAVKPTATVAISGGSSPLGFYTLLAKPGSEELLPWNKIHLFWVDERFVGLDNPDSNFGTAQEAFLQDLHIPPENLHPISTAFATPEEAAAAYREKLRQFFGGGIPVFDLMLLGMGLDGHTASLFPQTASLTENALPAIAVAPPEMVEPKVPRITMTFPVINRAGKVMMITSGEEKQNIIRDVATAAENAPAKYPVQLIDNENLIWFVSLI